MVGDPEHPAISHFDAETRADIREQLENASARLVGRHMIRGDGVSNAVYNAAANLTTTAFLGGPAALTRRIRARHPDFAGIASRRYMLAARAMSPATTKHTARSLAAVPRGDRARRCSRARPPRPRMRVRDILFLEETDDGRHFFKGGSLNSNPITRVLSGYFEQPGEAPGRQLVYVFMAELPGPGSVARDNLEPGEAGRKLLDHLEALRVAALPVARRWLGTGVALP